MPTVRLDLGDPQGHLLAVTIEMEAPRPHLRLRLPAWTPGSYLIRDYVRHLEGLEVLCAGRPCPIRRLGPASWQVDLAGRVGEPLRIHYQLMATELSVRTCHLDGDHGFFALAAVVLEMEGERWSPHRLEIRQPPDWQGFVSLPQDGDGAWLARDFDQLIDTPLELGPHRCDRFAVCGVPHRWVTWEGGAGSRDWLQRHCPTLLADVQATAGACCRLMGAQAPASADYLFILHLLDGGYGGLEHDDSCVLVYGRASLQTPAGYRKFLQLVAHEYLHQWNVRRLRPAELTPIDYHQAVPVPSLWFAEGITSYFDQFLPLTAGLSTETDLLTDLGQDLSRYLFTPGRQVQSLRDSSQEAWVKLYKSDAYSSNSQISYYLKGAVVALVLDLILRRHGASLTQVLHNLWQSHGQWGRGYHEADLVEAFAEFHAPLSSLLPQWLRSQQDPPLHELLADVGLELTPETETHLDLGACVELKGGQLWVQRVNRDGPASDAGLMVGDELVALDAERLLNPEDLASLLNLKRAGQQRQLLIARDSLIRSLTISPASPSIKAWTLGLVAGQTGQTTAQRNRWLSLQPA